MVNDFTWQDPKTGLTHTIASHSSPFDSSGTQSKRMKCGLEVIVVDGFAYKYGLVVVPWIHGHDVTTCFECIIKDRLPPWKIRGA